MSTQTNGRWFVEFYFTPARGPGEQILFRSESMPRDQAESVMDEIIDRKGILECWLQRKGQPSADESDKTIAASWNEIDPQGQETP